MALPRRLYLLIHTPVELARPTCLGLFRDSPRNVALYNDFVRNAEAARSQHGVQNYLMSKDEAQKWTPYLPSGLRAQIMPVQIPAMYFDPSKPLA